MSGSLPAPGGDFTVTAIVATYNEEDVIGQVVADLVRQGVQVYLLDDGSTDGTVAEVEPWAGRGVVGIERRPAAATGSWAAILRRKEELARELDADWFLHQDADELRESPWEGLSLYGAIRRVDRLGYDAIDFQVLDFQPTGEEWKAGDDLRASFTHWSAAQPDDKLQVKAWRKTADVDLVSSGGHEARFPGRRVCPLRFLSRHYPVRSQAHGERKVFRERLSRLAEETQERGWHVHYQRFAPGTSFVRDPATLTRFDADAVRFALIENHRGVEELADEAAGSAEQLARTKTELGEAQRARGTEQARGEALGRELDARLGELDTRNRECDAERERAEELSRQLDARNRELEGERTRAEDFSRDLDLRNRELEEARHRADGLAHDLDERNRELERLAAEGETARADLAATQAALAATRADLAARERLVAELLASRSWRWTAPVRALLRGLAPR